MSLAAQSEVTPTSSWATRLLEVALVLFLLGYGFAILSLCSNRLSHEAIVDSDESIHSLFAWQSSQGIPLYGPRDNPYVQDLFSYTPGCFQVMGLVARLVGHDVVVYRLVTLVFSLAASVMLGLIAFKLGRSRLIACVSAVLFLAYPQPAWYITIGPNPFLAFFAFSALYLLLRDPHLSVKTVVLASIAAFLAFWCKQTGLIYIAALVFALAWVNIRRALLAVAIVAGLFLPLLLYYASVPGSSFLYNVFILQKQSPMNWGAIVFPVMFPEMLGRFAPLLALFAWTLLQEKSWKSFFGNPAWMFLGGAIFVGFVARLKYGSGPTQGILMGGLLAAVVFSLAWRLLAGQASGRLLVTALMLVQASCLLQPYAPYHINDEDMVRYRTLMEWIKPKDREVYYNNHSYYNVLADKKVYTSMGRDCYWKGVMDRSRYPQKLREFLNADPFDVIIVDVPLEDNSWPLYERLQAGGYQQVGELPATARHADVMTLRYRKVVMAKKDSASKRGQPEQRPVGL